MQERLKQSAAVNVAAYVQARQELEQVKRVIDDVFAEVDFVLTPTTPVPPITIDQALNMSPDPAGELWLRNTRPFNAYGVPTISVPCRFTSSGLPIGLQIAGASLREASLLSFGRPYMSKRLCGTNTLEPYLRKNANSTDRRRPVRRRHWFELGRGLMVAICSPEVTDRYVPRQLA
jgi:Asp-tRNA(Asn)/Glu-tRNA(Gln) amidotransferase A subunit family amidase